jgi:hypothetical protein
MKKLRLRRVGFDLESFFVCVCMNGVNDVIAVNYVNECTNDLMIGTIILRGGEKCHVPSVH